MLTQKDYGLFLIGLAVTVLLALWLDNKYGKLHALTLGCCGDIAAPRIGTPGAPPVTHEGPTRTIKEEFNL